MRDKKISVMIVDDHPLFRQGLRRVIEAEDDMEVIIEAGDGEEALHLAQEMVPDVIMMDVNIPTMNGLQVTRSLKASLPNIGVIILTAYHDDEQIFHAIKAGASAYYPKDVTPRKLLEAIRQVSQGNYVIDDKVLAKSQVASRLLKQYEQISASDELFAPLSPREMEVLQLIARGYSNKEIAHELDINRQTVKNYITSILRKLAVTDRTQAALYALRRGWIRLQDLDNDIEADGDWLEASKLTASIRHDIRSAIGIASSSISAIQDEFAPTDSAYQLLFEAQNKCDYCNTTMQQLKTLLATAPRIQKLERGKVHVSSLTELDEMTAGIRHDIETALVSIPVVLTQVSGQHGAKQSIHEDLLRARRAVDYATILLKSLTDLFGGKKPKPSLVDIHEVIEHTLFLIDQRRPQHVRVTMKYFEGALLVEMSGVHLQEILINLLLNAFESIRRRGDVTIQTCRLDELHVMELSISDTGCGIPPEDLERIFNFYTTKRDGYGVGLHIVKSIVESYNGEIEVTSQVNKGTRFRVRIPLRQQRDGSSFDEATC